MVSFWVLGEKWFVFSQTMRLVIMSCWVNPLLFFCSPAQLPDSPVRRQNWFPKHRRPWQGAGVDLSSTSTFYFLLFAPLCVSCIVYHPGPASLFLNQRHSILSAQLIMTQKKIIVDTLLRNTYKNQVFV